AVVALDTTQHAHGVTLVESRSQDVDVVPDHRRNPARAVGQLQRQERVTVAGASPALTLHRERGLDQRTFLELGYVGAFGHRRMSLFHRPAATRLPGTDGRHG